VLIYFRPGMRQSAHHPEPFESPFESPFGGWPHLGAGFSAFDWSSLGLGVTRLSSHAQWNSGPPGNQTQPQKKATYTSIGGRGCVSRPMSRSHSGRHSGGGPILGRFSASSLGALWNLGPPRNSAETDGTWGHPRIRNLGPPENQTRPRNKGDKYIRFFAIDAKVEPPTGAIQGVAPTGFWPESFGWRPHLGVGASIWGVAPSRVAGQHLCLALSNWRPLRKCPDF
jgi:hypothetical protein